MSTRENIRLIARAPFLWCVAEKSVRFAYLIFIVKGQDEIYLASELADVMVIC